ncbi:MAG: hypothetical protein GTO03_08550, partial [Planctomycetales bacterium]|nr:hypothetical protein [Planctomycetales bacterium]
MWCKHCQQDVPGIAVEETPPPDAGQTAHDPRALNGQTTRPAAQRGVAQPASPTDRPPGYGDQRPRGAEAASHADHPPGPDTAARFVCARCGEAIGSDSPDSLDEHDTRIDQGFHQAARADAAARAKFEAWEWELDQELHDIHHLLEAHGERRERSVEHRAALYHEIDDVLETRVTAGPTTRPKDPSQGIAPASSDPAEGQPGSIVPWLVLALGLMGLTCGGVLLVWSLVAGRSELWRVGLPIAVAG